MEYCVHTLFLFSKQLEVTEIYIFMQKDIAGIKNKEQSKDKRLSSLDKE